MKSSITLFVLISCATIACSQTSSKPNPSAQTQTTPASPSSNLKTRGPEAIAEKDPNKVVATANGKQITAKQAYDLLKLLPEEQRRSAANLQALLEKLYTVKDLSDEAVKQNLDKQSPVREQIELDRDNILAQAYLAHLASSSGQTTQDPKQYYDSHQDQFDIAKLSGIVVGFNPPGTPANANGVNRTEQQAQEKVDDLEKKLKAGADIATLARTDSDNQNSASRGGDLGTLAAGAPGVPAEIKNVIFNKLQPGQISEPIRTPNAFYIIKLDSRTKQSFDQAKPEISKTLEREKTQALMKQIADKYKMQVQDPDFFGAPTSAGPKIPSLANPSSASPSASAAAKPQNQH